MEEGLRSSHIFSIPRLVNYVMKQGAKSANTLGVVAVLYSVFGVGLSWARETEDDLNTLAAATATGLMFKSTAGLRKCAKGGAFGFALAAVYCAYNNADKLRDWSS